MPREKKFSEADIDEALDRLFSDPSSAGSITIALMLESRVVLRVTDPAVIEAMLKGEIERRRQAREARA